jgi:hypothetical protein
VASLKQSPWREKKPEKYGSLGIAVIKLHMGVPKQTADSLPNQGKCVEKDV